MTQALAQRPGRLLVHLDSSCAMQPSMALGRRKELSLSTDSRQCLRYSSCWRVVPTPLAPTHNHNQPTRFLFLAGAFSSNLVAPLTYLSCWKQFELPTPSVISFSVDLRTRQHYYFNVYRFPCHAMAGFLPSAHVGLEHCMPETVGSVQCRSRAQCPSNVQLRR